MYDPNASRIRFETAHNYIEDYISKKMVDDISEEALKELYSVLIANETMKSVMFETQVELLKRMIQEKENDQSHKD